MNEKSNAQQEENVPPPHAYPPPPYYYPPPYEEDETYLLDLWRVIWASKWLIISITTLCTAFAVAAALLMTPIYRSEVLMAPVSEDQSSDLSRITGQFGGLAALAGINLGGDSGNVEEAIALLKSRTLAEKFIKDENLLPTLTKETTWATFIKRIKFWKKKEPPTLSDAYKKFDKDVRSVSIDAKTGLVTLVIDWEEPNVAAEWAQKLVNNVNTRMRERAIYNAEKSLAYLNKELKKTSAVEMHDAIYSLIEGQIKTIMFANVRDEYSFKTIDPPAVADLDDEVWPKKKLMTILGTVLGFLLGASLAWIKSLLKEETKTD